MQGEAHVCDMECHVPVRRRLVTYLSSEARKAGMLRGKLEQVPQPPLSVVKQVDTGTCYAHFMKRDAHAEGTGCV